MLDLQWEEGDQTALTVGYVNRSRYDVSKVQAAGVLDGSVSGWSIKTQKYLAGDTVLNVAENSTLLFGTVMRLYFCGF